MNREVREMKAMLSRICEMSRNHSAHTMNLFAMMEVRFYAYFYFYFFGFFANRTQRKPALA